MTITVIVGFVLVACIMLGLTAETSRVRLSQAWTNPGDNKAYAEGTRLELNAEYAAEMVAKGYAEALDDESDDDGSGDAADDPTKKKAADPPKDADDDSANKGDGAGKDPKDATPATILKVAELMHAMQVDQKRSHIRVIGEAWEHAKDLGYAPYGNQSPEAQAVARGRWLIDVMAAGKNGDRPGKMLEERQKFLEHRRLVSAKALGSDEYAAVEDSIGGFFIQPDFDDRLLVKGFESEFIRSSGAQVIPTNSTMLKINAEVDIDRQTNLYGGVDVFFKGERQAGTSARGKFEQVNLTPDWLMGLYFATDTLIRSAPALGAIVGRQFQEAFQRKETLAFLNGTGAGEPLGIFNAPGTFNVTRNTASTIKHEDVINMMARCWDKENAVWIAGLGTFSAIANMAFTHIVENQAGTENVGGSGQLTWHANIANAAPAPLLGRPLIFSEHATALGTKGDLSLVSWRHYLIAESTDFVNDSSIHVRFDSLETAFRFAKRLDGQPWWRSTLTVQNSFVMSPYVVLAT